MGRAGSFESEGVIVGLVGARFKKEGKMESQHMIVSAKLSRREFGYGVEGAKHNPVAAANLQFFAALYSQPSPSASRFYFPSYEEAAADRSGKFHRLANGSFFNIAAYKARIGVSIECLLVEANARAQEAGKIAYVFVVGLGLGLWMECKQQPRWFVDAVGESLQSISLPFVADVDLNWFPSDVNTCGGASSGQTLTGAAGNQIAIHFTTRSPADRLPPSDPPKLLVVSYAWDGNAFPGNEYWNGLLSSSGDSAAACCSTIVELQNAWINAGFLDRQHLIQPVRSTA